jgi:NACHT domain
VKLRPELDVTEHLLLLGRKGVGKTTLAQRIVSRAAADGQLCFFVRAIKYRNDFGKMLQLAVAPFSSRSTKELVETAEQCAAPILVVLDGVDRISDDLREDLLSGAAGFFERHRCTVVVTASSGVTLPPNIRGATMVVPELSFEERQKIYRHYASAGAPELDVSAFPTPQDLKVAGQAAAKLPKNATPSRVCDAYIRLQLGIEIASLGGLTGAKDLVLLGPDIFLAAYCQRHALLRLDIEAREAKGRRFEKCPRSVQACHPGDARLVP